MRYVEVAVDAPVGCGRTLSYSLPPRMDLEPGQLVWAPLGTRPVQGVVFELTDQPQVDATKDVLASIEPSPLVTSHDLDLARWISRYYMSSLFQAVALFLPPGSGSKVRSYLREGPQPAKTPSGLAPKDRLALAHLTHPKEVEEKGLAKLLGKDGEAEVRRLLRTGLVQRRWELPRPKILQKYRCCLLPVGPDRGIDDGAALDNKRASKQAALYNDLIRSAQPYPISVANKAFGPPAVQGLFKKGLLALEWEKVERRPLLADLPSNETDLGEVLTAEQTRALAEIASALEARPGAPRRFLLHGVTGSGKTEVYIRSLEHCVRNGKKGIYLVPEIALTPQTVHHLNARFPDRVAVLHSRLSAGQLFDQWWRIRDGDYDVVVGPRSALFAPVSGLGLIVIDEEHEWTYKQHDSEPRYHARDVALKLADLSGAVVIMGSATPDVETYHRAQQGEYKLLELPRRIGASPTLGVKGAPLASVEVCDMRQELKEGNRSIFSRSLSVSLARCIEAGEQAVLFLNRRGAATVVQCRDCGLALECSRCSVPLTYHSAGPYLLCHHCNRRSSLPRGCPQCRSPRIRYLGLGTQRVAEELNGLLPQARALRWDGDAARADGDHGGTLKRFLEGEAQVLIGTQMVAKGLHVPNVSLVGVVLADIGLNLPDFRAGERTFQLLCQVAGRAGRGTSPGKVIIQTYNPANYAVEAASEQNYGLLFSREMGFRRQQSNPPFSRLVHLVYVHTNAGACQREAERLGRALRRRAYAQGLTDVELVGPAPAFPQRVRGGYRWHVILRGRNLHSFLENVTLPQGWSVDVDPVSVM